jgi:hypothetical protein
MLPIFFVVIVWFFVADVGFAGDVRFFVADVGFIAGR